jgi:calcium-dependent protein kinase
MKMIKKELRILKRLDHPNIIKLLKVYEDAKYIHLVMEYCSGKPLGHKKPILNNFTEADVSNIMG